MITTFVPNDTPLTSDQYATTVWVVLDANDKEVVGVYPSLQRAVAYITDWIMAGDPPIDIPIIKKINEFTWQFGFWIIQRSNYRL